MTARTIRIDVRMAGIANKAELTIMRVARRRRCRSRQQLRISSTALSSNRSGRRALFCARRGEAHNGGWWDDFPETA
jgi:hypothetical protein